MLDFSLMVELLPLYGGAALQTLALVGLAGLCGLVLGFVLNAVRIFGGPVAARVLRVYTALWRGTPLLAQLFIVYFGLPELGLALDPFTAAALALTLYSAAYFAEIFRASWEAIPAGQIEAARAMGIARGRCFLHIEMPQALRLSVPLLTNQWVLVLKESALASVITVPELTMTTTRVVAERFSYLEPYVLLALSYWGLTLLVQAIGRYVQRKTA
ncbi:amino acid ABC transporter permease [Xylophilus sp. GW821-FHT01B05]